MESVASGSENEALNGILCGVVDLPSFLVELQKRCQGPAADTCEMAIALEALVLDLDVAQLTFSFHLGLSAVTLVEPQTEPMPLEGTDSPSPMP